jgi:hypothetical protein
MLIQDRDAYGFDWEADLELYLDLATIEQKTAELPIILKVDSQTKESIIVRNACDSHRPGFIPYISDF